MVIFVIGPAGAGKTTIGHALAVELGWRFLDADDYHPAANVEKMRAGMPLGDADRAPWLATIAALTSRAIDRREHIVIACSALKARYRDILRDDLRPIRFVYLRASEPLLRHRLATRAAHFAGPDLVETQLADLEEPIDEALVVDAGTPPEEILAAVRRDFGI